MHAPTAVLAVDGSQISHSSADHVAGLRME
jgi:hypothetical protein